MCRHPDVVIDIELDATNTWGSCSMHAGRQIMALMVHQVLVEEYLQERPELPSWFSLICTPCKNRSVCLCIDDSNLL